jgi:cell wall-associated NlpC family hydrolase
LTVTRNDIIKEARGWVGVPFRHQGRTRRGVDCAGLVIEVARALGLADCNIRDYRRTAAGYDFTDVFDTYMNKIPLDARQAGDVILFRFGRFDCHCGIITDAARCGVVHAYQPAGVVLDEHLSPQSELMRSISKAYRFRGVV